jgi:putative intracellular protease/amidase
LIHRRHAATFNLKELAMNMKHVLFILTNTSHIGPNNRATGYFFPEVAHPVEVFDHAGVAVEFASPLGGTPPEDGYDESDPSQLAFRNSLAIRRMARSRKLSEVDVRDYDAIFFPGGLGPMVDIATDPEVKQAVARAWDAGKIVAAVCHGPAALLGVKLEDGSALLQGRKLTSFSNAEEAGYAQADVPFLLEDALKAEGAEYSSADVWQNKVVLDGRLMTGQNPASGGPLAEAIVAALHGAAK